MIAAEKGFGRVDEHIPLGHHAHEGVEVLIINVIVRTREGIPAEGPGQFAVQVVRVDEARTGGCNLALEGHEMPGETVVGQVILDADVQVSSLVEYVQRPVPLIVGKQVQHEQLRFREIILLGRDGEFDLIGNFIGIFGIQDAGPNDILFVHGNEEPARYQVVHLASAGQGNLGLRVLEDGHDVGNRQGLLAGIVDGNVFVGTVQILLRTHGQVQRSRFVHGVFHLVDVPVGSQQ